MIELELKYNLILVLLSAFDERPNVGPVRLDAVLHDHSLANANKVLVIFAHNHLLSLFVPPIGHDHIVEERWLHPELEELD